MMIFLEAWTDFGEPTIEARGETRDLTIVDITVEHHLEEKTLGLIFGLFGLHAYVGWRYSSNSVSDSS